jgi:phage FluMu gp28-like protein
MANNSGVVDFLSSLSEEDRTSALKGLTTGEVRAVLAELDSEYQRNPWAWFMNEVNTQDEATQAMLPWPDKSYLRDLVWVLDHEKGVVIPKSRRMMVSWICAAWAVYRARYQPHHAIFYQSETEEKAAFITDQRCIFIENNLREPLLRRKYKAIKTHQGLVGRITYADNGSYIWAIPQGDDAIRSFTFSILIMDESEFQPEAEKALVSALPIWEKGAQLIILSTSNGPQGILAGICRDVGFTKFM